MTRHRAHGRDARRLASSALAVCLTALMWPSMPAHAGAQVTLSTANTSVGVGVTVTVTGATPRATETVVATDGHTTQRMTVLANDQGTAAFLWTPTSHDYWTISLANAAGQDTGSTRVFSSAAKSTTIITAPSSVTVKASTRIVATIVGSVGSMTTPRGYVQFLRNGAIFGPPVRVKPGYPSTATLPAHAKRAGRSTFTAQFIPNGNGVAQAIDCRPACASGAVSVNATRSATKAQVVLPSLATKGARTMLMAWTPGPGTVTFWAGGRQVGSATADAQGTATRAWFPQQAGTFAIEARWAGGGRTAQAQGRLTVTEATAVDTIVLDPQGAQAAWTSAAANTVVAGDRITLVSRAASTGPVSLTTQAPCQLSGQVLTAKRAGTCVVVARSAGGFGYAGATQQYVVTVLPK